MKTILVLFDSSHCVLSVVCCAGLNVILVLFDCVLSVESCVLCVVRV